MDWSGVDYLWIIVMLLSAVWTLILTAPIAEDPSIYLSKSVPVFSFVWTIPLRMLRSFTARPSTSVLTEQSSDIRICRAK